MGLYVPMFLHSCVCWKLLNTQAGYVVKPTNETTISNSLVSSLVVSDLLLGLFRSVPFSVSALVTSQWPFNVVACQFQGFMIAMLAATS